jgi:dUTP pyrophosphatase
MKNSNVVDWAVQRKLRAEAPIGTYFHFGKMNFGVHENVLPLIRRTKTQLICSDGNRTERAMISSGKILSHTTSRVKAVSIEEAEAILARNAKTANPTSFNQLVLPRQEPGVFKKVIPVKVKKLHPNAVIPTYGTPGSACFDLVAISAEPGPGNTCTFGTGLAMEIPEDHVLLVFSRSGHGFKQGIRLANCVGVIDSDYRGQIQAKLTKDGDDWRADDPWIGQKVAQGLVLPINQCTFEEVDELSSTERGESGFGSTGR